MSKNFICVANILFELNLDIHIKEEFINRIDLSKVIEPIHDIDIIVKCIREKKIKYMNKEFLTRQEPIITKELYKREIFNLGNFEYCRNKKELIIHYEVSDDYQFNSYEVVTDTIFQFIYLILLDFNIIPLHTSVVRKDMFGIMIFGNSGAGKTTLQMSLLNNGYKFYADDVSFLDKDMKLYCSGENVTACTPNTIKLINECFNANIVLKDVSSQKQYLNHKNANNNLKILPIIILFPVYCVESKEEIIRCSKVDSFVNLIKLCISNQFSVDIIELYIRRLKSLVENSEAYYVYRSDDFDKNLYLNKCIKLSKIIDSKFEIEEECNE